MGGLAHGAFGGPSDAGILRIVQRVALVFLSLGVVPNLCQRSVVLGKFGRIL